MAEHGDYKRRQTWRQRDDSIFSDDDDRSSRTGGSGERGFIERAGDEVRSWFGDEEAERRRERDVRRDEGGTQSGAHRDNGWSGETGWGSGTSGSGRSSGGSGRSFRGGSQYDQNYLAWRERQIAQFDRDYEEYCRERGDDFEQGFQTWRNSRLTEGGTGGSAMFGVGSNRPNTETGEASAMTASTGSSGDPEASRETVTSGSRGKQGKE